MAAARTDPAHLAGGEGAREADLQGAEERRGEGEVRGDRGHGGAGGGGGGILDRWGWRRTK